MKHLPLILAIPVSVFFICSMPLSPVYTHSLMYTCAYAMGNFVVAFMMTFAGFSLIPFFLKRRVK